MDRQEFWMKDPELKAAYEALGPNFRREVEQAQQRRGQRTLQGAAIASRGRSTRPHQPHSGAAARR
ncbi:hypothetical protein HUE56_05975 (plasmid) [Azospirillum oryzae]|uniref:Uncharacterized protein n=1 Tax=Azospirillum oryzae TaxID=286727 RepID=A0A6N1AEU2_9PROT|nr:hypothetical protein [Azospirillum oryzae]QKS50066.1 hypothetical protein HUE56_05975 [Azospirillum oryzae]GLR81269.1 hypothetical protein GCM10007856_39530 [Azospirillum oryzae]